jgi:hypothetical protein
MDVVHGASEDRISAHVLKRQLGNSETQVPTTNNDRHRLKVPLASQTVLQGT